MKYFKQYLIEESEKGDSNFMAGLNTRATFLLNRKILSLGYHTTLLSQDDTYYAMNDYSVTNFTIYEIPDFRFGIWWGVDDSTGKISGELFAMTEAYLDKFKPSRADYIMNIDVYAEPYLLDDGSIGGLDKVSLSFGEIESWLAYLRDNKYEAFYKACLCCQGDAPKIKSFLYYYLDAVRRRYYSVYTKIWHYRVNSFLVRCIKKLNKKYDINIMYRPFKNNTHSDCLGNPEIYSFDTDWFGKPGCFTLFDITEKDEARWQNKYDVMCRKAWKHAWNGVDHYRNAVDVFTVEEKSWYKEAKEESDDAQRAD